MSNYKQLYEHLASAPDTFTLMELAAMDTALSWYSEELSKMVKPDSSVHLTGEIEMAESALKKVRYLYKKAGGPKLK